MTDKLFAVARQKVDNRNLDHRVGTRLLLHGSTRHSDKHLCRQSRIVD